MTQRFSVPARCSRSPQTAAAARAVDQQRERAGQRDHPQRGERDLGRPGPRERAGGAAGRPARGLDRTADLAAAEQVPAGADVVPAVVVAVQQSLLDHRGPRRCAVGTGSPGSRPMPPEPSGFACTTWRIATTRPATPTPVASAARRPGWSSATRTR